MTQQKPNIQYIAAKALIKNDKNEVLVLKQADATISGGDQFHPPGGIVEIGESLKDCLAREVMEELGVEAEVGTVVDVGEWYSERDDDRMQFVGIYLECHISSYEFSLEASEVSDYAWVNLQSIDEFDILEPSKSIIKKFLMS